MNYTKEERLEIYKKALELLSKNNRYGIDCFCHALTVASNFDVALYTYNTYIFKITFPEVYALKPKRTSVGYWWSPDDREIRIKKLTAVINKMEKEIKP